jgi:uncharacterized protein
MARNIDQDLTRFKNIVRGKVRQNLRKYINHGEMIGRKGRNVVSIPVPSIAIPHFRHGPQGSGGVGQGEGEDGQAVGKGGQQQQGDGTGAAGDQPGGQHYREVELTLDELAEMLGEELELPNIVPKGKDSVTAEKDRYTSISQNGPDSLRHFKRTYKRALKRSIASNDYRPDNPVIIPSRDDFQYRSWKTVHQPEANAALIYIMDVSGSMMDEQKDIVRTEAFWIDTWLRRQYDGVECRYIIHDAVARVVDEDTFYTTRESGGTRISSAYKVCADLIQREFNPSEWNIYCFQFSDGDNWGEDNNDCLKMLAADIIAHCNLYCYGQVESPYGSGDFIQELRTIADAQEKLVLSEIPSKDAISESIRQFLGKGK